MLSGESGGQLCAFSALCQDLGTLKPGRRGDWLATVGNFLSSRGQALFPSLQGTSVYLDLDQCPLITHLTPTPLCHQNQPERMTHNNGL